MQHVIRACACLMEVSKFDSPESKVVAGVRTVIISSLPSDKLNSMGTRLGLKKATS